MDYNKIGLFITNQRKALNLTQAKLAEKIFVSEKTISKWENGNGIPDTTSLPKLCEVFDCSINELLNGEKISQDDYLNRAEEKLLELQKAREEKDRLLLNVEIVMSICSLITFFTIIYTGAYIIKSTNLYIIPIILFVVGFASLITTIIFAIRIEQKAGYYKCEKCGHKHVPTFFQVLWAPHVNRTRRMKCPHCKQKSWQKKILK